MVPLSEKKSYMLVVEAIENAESCFAPFSGYHALDDDGEMRSTTRFLIRRDRRARFRGSIGYLIRSFLWAPMVKL